MLDVGCAVLSRLVPLVSASRSVDARHSSNKRIDVVKVRLMTDKHRQLNGVFHGVKTIFVNEGPMAFYKGFGMCWARVRTMLHSNSSWLTEDLDSWARTP